MTICETIIIGVTLGAALILGIVAIVIAVIGMTKND